MFVILFQELKKQYNEEEWETECIVNESSTNGQQIDIKFDDFTNGAKITQVEKHIIKEVNTCHSSRKGQAQRPVLLMYVALLQLYRYICAFNRP